MKLFLAGPVLALLIAQSSCDPSKLVGASPRQIQLKTEQAVRPYFPNAVVQVEPQQAMILVTTCARNLGPAMLQEIAHSLPDVDEFKKLDRLRRYGTLLGAKPYRQFVLAFEHQQVVYDIEHGTASVAAPPDPTAYDNAYSTACATAPAK